MPNSWFRFKQFTVHQDRCAMKVGTDGVLLGAWARHPGAARILDIGTGTGLLALIAAQRNPAALIDAVEVDAGAAQQARENAAASPWPERIRVYHADVRNWAAPEEGYDLILCNPPFYTRHRPSRDARTATAKHDVGLGLDQLVQQAVRLGAPHGRFCLVLPADRLAELRAIAGDNGFAPSRECLVRYVAGKAPKRALVELARGFAPAVQRGELAVEEAPGRFTPEYRALLSDLELHF